MCEFKVFLDGDLIMDDVMYAKSEVGRVVLRDVIGTEKVIENAEIVEVDVISTRLILKGNTHITLEHSRARAYVGFRLVQERY